MYKGTFLYSGADRNHKATQHKAGAEGYGFHASLSIHKGYVIVKVA